MQLNVLERRVARIELAIAAHQVAGLRVRRTKVLVCLNDIGERMAAKVAVHVEVVADAYVLAFVEVLVNATRFSRWFSGGVFFTFGGVLADRLRSDYGGRIIVVVVSLLAIWRIILVVV